MPATSSVLRTVITVGVTTALWIARSTVSATLWFVTSDSTVASWLQTLAFGVVVHVLWDKFMAAQNAEGRKALKELFTIDSMRNSIESLLDKSTDLIEWGIEHGIVRGKIAADWIDRENKKRVDELITRAKAGDGNASYILGKSFEHGLRGLSRNSAKAYQFYKTAASCGSVRGLNACGSCLVHGKGVERNATHGVGQTTSAAENGCASACFNLGFWYASGMHGLPMDRGEARTWLQRATAPCAIRELNSRQIHQAKEILNAL
mmetsp:Transcript_23780/g.68333  ORF Transcript_23780/g.68333 Transcript_23780/m.68333 type:complete len:263 (-) Transcript_23780:174-962(-)